MYTRSGDKRRAVVYGGQYSSRISGVCIIGLGLGNKKQLAQPSRPAGPGDQYTYSAVRSRSRRPTWRDG